MRPCPKPSSSRNGPQLRLAPLRTKAGQTGSSEQIRNGRNGQPGSLCHVLVQPQPSAMRRVAIRPPPAWPGRHAATIWHVPRSADPNSETSGQVNLQRTWPPIATRTSSGQDFPKRSRIDDSLRLDFGMDLVRFQVLGRCSRRRHERRRHRGGPRSACSPSRTSRPTKSGGGSAP